MGKPLVNPLGLKLRIDWHAIGARGYPCNTRLCCMDALGIGADSVN